MNRRLRRANPRGGNPAAAREAAEVESELRNAATGQLERLVFLSDGVFAIAMTLLAVELALPEVSAGSPEDLGQRLLALGPRYLSYALSFVVIASYWRSHQRIFRYLVRLDGRFVWLNLILLLCIAFLPFPTSVLGNYPSEVAAVSLYAGTLAATGGMVLLMWAYATTGHRLISAQESAHVIRLVLLRAACPPLIFLISIGIAQFDTDLAKYSWLAIAVVMNLLSWYYRDSS
jgi:uncharacterized membrane protein